MAKPTDLTILRALLDIGKRSLSTNEEHAFKGMLSDLEIGRIVRLSQGQRSWAEQKYFHLGLDRAYKDKAPPKVKVNTKGMVTSFGWEASKPLKPPGK